MEGSQGPGDPPGIFFFERLFHERTARIPRQTKALPGKERLERRAGTSPAIHRPRLQRPSKRPRAPVDTGEGRGGSDASSKLGGPPLPHVTIL